LKFEQTLKIISIAVDCLS